MRARRFIVTIALVAIALGIFARFDSLDHKILWFDESFSLLRISGHSQNAMYALFDGRVHRSDELLALQHVAPERGLGATLQSLHEEPQRGPLYYLPARLWIGLSGNATAAVRGLSVLLGIAGIAIAFLLGRRLTASREGGLVLAALVALSPIEIRFSQQVREYILVADLTLLSAWLLLRALERPVWQRWLVFGLCALAGLFTNPTFAFLMAGEGLVALFVAWRRGKDGGVRVAVGSIAAACAAVLCYLPWALAAQRAAERGSVDIAWAAGAYTLRATLLKWTFNTGAVFFDSEYAHVTWGVALLPLLAIVAVAVWRALVRKGDGIARGLALAVAFSTLVPIVALDVFRHAHYELIARYQMPTWLGIEMLVTLLLVPALLGVNARARVFSGAALAVLLLAGATSVAVDRTYEEWWDNNDHFSERAVANVVAAGAKPALVAASDAADNAYDTFVLSRYLEPGTAMLLYDEAIPALPRGYAATYLFTPSQAQLAAVRSDSGVAARNVSPSSGLAVPELNAARNAGAETVVATNSLWQVGPFEAALGARK